MHAGRVSELAAPETRDDLGPAASPQLAEDVLHVPLDGVLRHREPLRDLTVSRAGREQLDDIALALGQLGRAGPVQRGRSFDPLLGARG